MAEVKQLTLIGLWHYAIDYLVLDYLFLFGLIYFVFCRIN